MSTDNLDKGAPVPGRQTSPRRYQAGRPAATQAGRPDRPVVSDRDLADGRGLAAKFVLKKGSTGKFRFNLVATNGQVIATSEAYESKASAINGIESVKRNAPNAEIDDQTDK